MHRSADVRSSDDAQVKLKCLASRIWPMIGSACLVIRGKCWYVDHALQGCSQEWRMRLAPLAPANMCERTIDQRVRSRPQQVLYAGGGGCSIRTTLAIDVEMRVISFVTLYRRTLIRSLNYLYIRPRLIHLSKLARILLDSMRLSSFGSKHRSKSPNGRILFTR